MMADNNELIEPANMHTMTRRYKRNKVEQRHYDNPKAVAALDRALAEKPRRFKLRRDR